MFKIVTHTFHLRKKPKKKKIKKKFQLRIEMRSCFADLNQHLYQT